MTSSLVGSEMCIRDSFWGGYSKIETWSTGAPDSDAFKHQSAPKNLSEPVSYTHLTLPTICSV
eukprot:10728560-Prorocentrum_lima.AAC.1